LLKENFVSVNDFLKRFNPEIFKGIEAEMKTFAERQAAAAAAADVGPRKNKGKGKLEEPEKAEIPELEELYADVIAFKEDFVPSTKIHRIMSIITHVGKYYVRV
jgi:hypothetical protein